MIDENAKERAKRFVRDAGRWLWAANDALVAVHHAKDGSLLSRGLAAATIAGKAISMLLPDKTPRDQLLARGYKTSEVGLGSFFCSRLMAAGPNLSVSVDGDDGALRFLFWDVDGEQRAVAAVYDKDRWVDGPFVKAGREEFLAKAIEPGVWQGHDLMLGVGRSMIRRDQEETLELVPMKPPGVYIGEPGVEWFVERLRRHGDETRSMLLVGPTGIGKSTLGRLIAKELHAGGRVLKISSQALKHCMAPDVIDLVVVLKPDVLLLDDVSTIDHRRNGDTDQQLLELLEALHGKAKLLIATLMNDFRGHPQLQDTSDGGNYFSGMRPGRIDEVVVVKRPSPRVREKILRHYIGGDAQVESLGITQKLMADIVKRCDGLTGAYLGEVAHRFKVHGVKSYKSEINSVKSAAPEFFSGAGLPLRVRRRRSVRTMRKQAAKARAEREDRTKDAIKEAVKEAVKDVVVGKTPVDGTQKKTSAKKRRGS